MIEETRKKGESIMKINNNIEKKIVMFWSSGRTSLGMDGILYVFQDLL